MKNWIDCVKTGKGSGTCFLGREPGVQHLCSEHKTVGYSGIS